MLDYFWEYMFKDFFRGARRRGGWGQPNRARPMTLGAPPLLLLVAATGCGTLSPPLPPVNLNDPGWTVHEGQAVWSMKHGKRELAGEVLVATRIDGDAFVQFAKTPFPFLIGRLSQGRWEVQFPARNRRYSGPGAPPQRLIWLYLPRVLAGQPAPAGLSWRHDGHQWRLENPSAAESVEGYFTR